MIYGMDVRLPGMVYAALRQSPVHGGKVKSFDAEKTKAMPGVLAVVTVDPDLSRGRVFSPAFILSKAAAWFARETGTLPSGSSGS
jgi:CO/xanthine dehydrogenase Mo-binding subunit